MINIFYIYFFQYRQNPASEFASFSDSRDWRWGDRLFSRVGDLREVSKGSGASLGGGNETIYYLWKINYNGKKYSNLLKQLKSYGNQNWSVYTCCFAASWKISFILILIMYQCCNEDWKWTEDEYEDSSVSENRPKTNTKNLRQFKISSKIFEDCKFFEDLRRYEDFQRKMKNFCC